ncbi:uncharacterized protein N7515_009033 [Penicillium bovifimosum]|uniref:Zn(2)-C6 fungal-type domain-containing protein n=1 Tax=Penicillium bovifimosum TaxID=126998 RepID=A0A9W9KV46_9EURO|nr:uncharacterized protein N7515_009033 [Penicillium bovifimosum]KAJ5121072.1 hypothetical protein N7515_009033 [Penicillium bovifimosum]
MDPSQRNQDDPLVTYDWRSLTTPPIQHPYPTPLPFSPGVPTQVHSGPASTAGSTTTPAPKVAIPRLAGSDATLHGRRRSARACEPCRQRKIKCDGMRPQCGQCVYNNQTCSYEDVKRVRDQKRLRSLSKRVDAYEALLRDLEAEVDVPTAKKIRKAMKVMKPKSGKPPKPDGEESDDSSTSMGSLDAIDQVDEDLNRNEGTRAAGFFGKNSEVNWIRKLESGVRMQSPERPGAPNPFHLESESDPEWIQKQQSLERQIPTSMMDYHLDGVAIPLIEPCDVLAVPPRELADRYFDAYLVNVHPTFSAIRKMIFISQYQQFFNNSSTPTRKWLAVLNMIFAIGCRYCRLIDGPQADDEDDLLYLTRARHLGLHSNVLFEHTDLQQIQLELLVAIYLLCLGQVNRASKFSNMALRSALSLGINLRLTDDRTKDAAKESRSRLWWSIYSLEHLLASMTGRASCVGEGLCSVPAPLPCEEETFDHPDAKRLLQDPALRESQLRSTLFEPPSHYQTQAWVTSCPPCPSLFFHLLVDLTLITHALVNRVYSIEGLRKGASQTEYHVQKFSLKMDRWLAKLPLPLPIHHPKHNPMESKPHPPLHNLRPLRPRTTLTYFSARITLYRPCLTHMEQAQSTPTNPETSPHSQLRAEMATNCLQASCSLISVLPDTPNMTWLARTAPWWSVLHFLMQATTALLLGLAFSSHARAAQSNGNGDQSQSLLTPPAASVYKPLETDLGTVMLAAKKAFTWLHLLAKVDLAAKRAFLLCHGIAKRILPGLGG